jgi:hypothetical protein
LVAEYEAVFSTLEDVRAVINEKLRPADHEFLQTTTSLQKAVLNKFRAFKATGNGVAHKYGGFFKVLANIMEKSLDGDDVHADQSIIDRILEVMDRIEENLS